jgi:hypothetical protein
MNTYYSPREGSRIAREALKKEELEGSVPAGAFKDLDCGKEKPVRGAARKATRPFKWFDIRPLWISRNDVIAHYLHDPVDDMRRRWMAWLKKTPADLTIDATRADGKTSFLVVGDPGEGDASQCATVPPLLAAAKGTDFMVICSDVVYPTGDTNQYIQKHYEPYRKYEKPIYAIPGNHDWYDELEGFMHHICGVKVPRDFAPVGLRGIARLFWRRPRGLKEATERAQEDKKLNPRPPASQPAPYFAIDTGPVLVVGIDTGILGNLDRDQGEWLRWVSSAIDKPKILLTGKPIYVDGQYHPGPIERFNATVDDIVREPRHRYVAAIGGDIHNYQRYPVCLEDGRVIEYIVSGGGGAFMHATHRIDRIDLGGATEDGANHDTTTGDGFRCFPLRGASLHFYSRIARKELRRLIRDLLACFLVFAASTAAILALWAPRWWAIELAILPAIPAVAAVALTRYLGTLGAFSIAFGDKDATLTIDEASTWIKERLDLQSPPPEGEAAESTPTISPTVSLSPKKETLARLIYPSFWRTRGFLHAFFSEIFDIDDPPLYKQFLRIDADAQTLTISCYAAIGTEAMSDPPALEDQISIPLTAGD